VGEKAMTETVRIQVLMSREEAERFDSYCQERGFKKSTLIARLIREHLVEERFTQQQTLFKAPAAEEQGRR
jgi:metal-responsive CopG/Arc/MetJ family transcriptional regulator